MTDIIVKNVTRVSMLPNGAWMVEYDDASGHGFPPETLAWRAAEYGIDPTDTATLLEIVLHEPHVNLQHTDPTFLYNIDQDTARKAHLERVGASPTRVSDPHGHLDRVHKHHLAAHTPEAHAEKVWMVAQVRKGNHAPHHRHQMSVKPKERR
jgi:hypothetical protein